MKKQLEDGTDTKQADRPQSIKERARQARHDAYVRARDAKKKDPRTIQLKEKAKQLRRDANAKARERRKNDPDQIAFKEKLKKERQEASRRTKVERKAAAAATKEAERAIKDARLNVTFVGIG